MRIESNELRALWASSLLTTKRPKRKSIDRLIGQVRRSVREKIDAQMQAPMTLFDEAVRFLLAFEGFQFARELTTDNREFALHTTRLRADVLAIREMIILGQESPALALARVFFEDIEIAMGLAIDPDFAVAYGDASGNSDFWSKQIGYGRIYPRVRKFLEAGGGDAAHVEWRIEHHKALKSFLSGHVHPTTSSAFCSAFPQSIEHPGAFFNRPLGSLGPGLHPLCLTLADEIHMFSACCINMFIQPSPPLALAGYEPSAKMDDFIAAAHVLQELVVKYLDSLWKDYQVAIQCWDEASRNEI